MDEVVTSMVLDDPTGLGSPQMPFVDEAPERDATFGPGGGFAQEIAKAIEPGTRSVIPLLLADTLRCFENSRGEESTRRCRRGNPRFDTR